MATKKRPEQWFVFYVIDPAGVEHVRDRVSYDGVGPTHCVMLPTRDDPNIWQARAWYHSLRKAEDFINHRKDWSFYKGIRIEPVHRRIERRPSKYSKIINGRDYIIL